METTYTIIGSDGQQYGPITLEQLKTWISERRVTPDTNVLRSDTNSWLPAAQYTELEFSPQPAIPAAMPTAMAVPGGQRVLAPTAPIATSSHQRLIKSGASWFYFIAALSLANSIMAMSGSSWQFLVGLGITQFISAVGSGFAGTGTAVGLALTLVIVAIFAAMGVFAHKGHTWAFIVGIVLYGLDLATLIIFGVMFGVYDWISMGFHAFAMYGIFLGLRASIRLKQVQSGVTMQGR